MDDYSLNEEIINVPYKPPKIEYLQTMINKFNNNTYSNETNKIFIMDNNSLNEEIINVSNDPHKNEYYKAMINNMLEKNKDDKKVTTFFNKCTE